MECQYGPRRKGNASKRYHDGSQPNQYRQTCPARSVPSVLRSRAVLHSPKPFTAPQHESQHHILKALEAHSNSHFTFTRGTFKIEEFTFIQQQEYKPFFRSIRFLRQSSDFHIHQCRLLHRYIYQPFVRPSFILSQTCVILCHTFITISVPCQPSVRLIKPLSTLHQAFVRPLSIPCKPFRFVSSLSIFVRLCQSLVSHQSDLSNPCQHSIL